MSLRTAAALALFSASSVLGSWEIEQPGLATILLSIACPDDNTCFAGASQDGVGNLIFRTTNGGSSYDPMNMDPEGGQLMLMATAATSSDSAVTGGAGFGTPFQHTTDGSNFWNSEAFALIGATQNIQAVRGSRSAYGAVGDFGDATNAVAMSVDGGANWKTFSVPDMRASARYGSFPSSDVWYVSGGSWPSSAKEEPDVVALSETLSFNSLNATGVTHNSDRASASKNGYRAAVHRTDDGGATWEELFYEEGFYFNSIDCPTVDSCFVVGEGQGNARIMASHDAGRTWDVVWQRSGGWELMGLQFLTEREGWGCGVRIEGFEFNGAFLHTTDGGQTWEEHFLPGVFCTSVSFSSPGLGHATGLGLDGQSSTLVYRV